METTPGTVPRNSADDLVAHFFADENFELRERILELENERAWLVDTLKEAIEQLHRLTVQGTRYQARVMDLVELLRLARQDISTLSAQLRARQEEAAA